MEHQVDKDTQKLSILDLNDLRTRESADKIVRRLGHIISVDLEDFGVGEAFQR